MLHCQWVVNVTVYCNCNASCLLTNQEMGRYILLTVTLTLSQLYQELGNLLMFVVFCINSIILFYFLLYNVLATEC